MNPSVTANEKPIAAQMPCSIEEFLVAQKLLPRSVVVTSVTVANVTLAVADTRS